MLHKGIRRMSGHYRNGLRTWKWYFLLVLWILLLANPRPNVLGYFLGDIKAVLNGCEDHWTLQDKAAFPLLYKMTVCVNIRVVVPGPWIAFTYSSVHGLMPELGLEGDDGALYAWLLRVKHRFPLKLSQQDWHQVCLRRDVVGSSFSLEVDQHIVGHRVVIAQAIPSYGSLWLGCGQRDQSLGPSPGQVELYLFRVWSDLDQHSSCEDGSVIGWTSEFWGVTSANARQRDNSLLCELKCDINQLCSSNNAYFWMPVSVETEEETKPEQDIHGFMSRVFNCDGKDKLTATTRSDFDIFCLDVNQIKLEKVSCVIKENISEIKCGILLQLSPVVSACKLRQAGLSALQQASDKQIEATLTGEVERVGRNLCDGAAASSDGFVNCSSLEKMCQSRVQTTLTCTVLKPDNVPIEPHVTKDPCGSEETHFCNCTTFCNSPNHFYAQHLNITNANIDTKFLQNMLTKQVLQTCGIKPSLQCVKALDVLQNQGLKKTYVNCQKTIQSKSYSCMMILEMTKAITDCSTISVIQTLINNTGEVTAEGPLTHMVVCGDPGKPVDTLLTSNLTWFSSNLSASDVCKVNQTRLKCAANENLAVLLSDTCPSQLTLTPLPTKTTLSTTITTPQTTTKTTVATSTQQTTSIPTTTSVLTTFSTTTHPEIQTSLSTTTIPYTTTTTTSAKSTNSHNTEISTQQSTTQSEPFTSLNTTLLDTTLKATSTQTSHHTTANSINNVTTTTISLTQSQTTVNDTTTATTFSSPTNEVRNTTTVNPPTPSTFNKITTLLMTSNKATTATPTTSSSTPATTANTTDTTTARTIVDRTTNANTTSTTANKNYTTTVNNMGDTAKVSSTTTTDTIDTTTASTIVDKTSNANTASTTTANRNYTTTGNDVGNTAKVSSTTTTNTNDTTTASNTISSTTISITVSTTPTANVLNSTTSGSTASSTTTANRNNTATTANILNGTSSGSTASSTTTANRNNTVTTAITVDHSTEENTASTTTPNSIDNSTKTTIAKIVTGTTDVNTADSTTMSRTITTAAPTVNSTAKTNSTSSYTVHAALMASIEDNTTKVRSTTTSNADYNATTASTYQTISGQTIVNNASTTSGTTTNATSPTMAPNVISTTSHATTIETLTTSPSSTGLNTTTPFSSTTSHVTVYNTTMIISSQPNTTYSNTTHFNETLGMISTPLNGTTGNASTTASPLPSTQSTNTPSTSLPNTTTEETSTNAYNQSVSESTTIEATHSQVTMANVTTAQTYTSTPDQPTKDVTTPVPHSTSAQQNTQSISTTSVGTTPSESTITHNGTTEATTPNSVTTADALTQYSKIFNVTSPTTVTTTSNHSLVLGSTTTEAITQSPDNVTMTSASINSTTTTATSVSSVTQNTTDLQGSTITTNYTTIPTSAMVYNVTTSSNISITATSAYNETGVNRMLNNAAVTSNTSSTTATPMSSVASTTFTTTKATVSTFTTPYNQNYNVTKTKEKSDTPTTMTTTTSTTTYTPLINHTAGYNVIKYDHNDTKMSNISTTAMPSLNITVTSLPNYTLTYNATTKGSTYTSIALENTTTISQNTTVKVNATVAVTTEPQITITPFESTTAATQVSNVTLTQKTTIASVTTIYANVTKPTLAPLGNFTANLTTPSMSNMTVADLNGTVPTTSFTPRSKQTTLSSTDDITTTSTMKTDVTSTTEVTNPGAVLSSQSTTTPTNTTTTAAATTTGPQPTQDRTDTTTEAPPGLRTTLQTSTISGTATTKPGSMTTKQTTRTQQELEEEANNLLSQTESRLNSSQVSKLVGQLESLLDGPTVSQAVGKKAINIISNLMEGDAQALSASANRLIRLVDGLGVKLVVSGENEILSSTSLVLAVQTVNGSNFRPTTVHIHNTDNVQLNHGRTKSTGAPLGSVFLPSSLTEGLSPDQQHRASRVHFTFYAKNTLFQDATLNNQTITSPVLGTSVASLPISNLREHIQFTIRNVDPINTNHSTSCVFWDFTVNGGAGGWNNTGCHVVNATPEDTTCSCSHLTSFAVLLDLSREGVTDRQQAQILTFITYIGCGVSALFLSITILTYITFEKLLRDIPAKILVQLCISLLFLNLVFLMDGWLALYKLTGLCISTAFFLHYFLLTSFTWAGLEALHMYLSIVRVFTPYLSQYMMKFSIMGWGIPLIVVVIIVAVDRNNYGLVSYGRYTDGTTDDFCWLRNNTAFYVGVVAYFLLIFILCLIVFIVVLVQLARIKRQNPQNQSPNRGVLSDLRSISGLVILLGLTWGFALFAWGPLYLPFVYLFSIFNSLQGFFIFVFHCAVKENVQRQWRTYLCCGKLRLAENSEWSRTATHTNKNVSFAMMSSSATHLTSSSASVISETNSSGSVYADSGISDSSNSDVVMNEIHRRSMALQGNL